MVAVVQSATIANATSGSFGSNVGAGNTVFLVICCFNTTGNTISSSAPTFGGSPASGAVKLKESQSNSAGTESAYTATWMLPNLAGGAASVGITVTNGTVNANTGLLLYEVSGLGTNPTLDQSNSGEATSGTALSSGASGAITQAPEFVLGAWEANQGSTAPGAPWTSQFISGAGVGLTGYQIPGSSGSSYTFSGTGNASGLWAATIVTVYAGSSGVTATFSLAMAPLGQSFTGKETISGHFSLPMAPLGQSFTGHETGANITATFSLGMAPLRMSFRQPQPGGGRLPDDDDRPRLKRWRRRRFRL